MKSLVTFYSTFFILITFISIVVVPVGYFFQKKNFISTKNTLAMIYTLVASAIIISIINPQAEFLFDLRCLLFGEAVSSMVNSLRMYGWTLLVEVLTTEKNIYTVLLITLSAMGLIGLVLYVSSIVVILVKVKKLRNFKKIGKLRILVEDTNTTPHVFSIFRNSYIVVPSHSISRKEILKTAVNHEIQHIRNGDTHSIYFWQLLKCLFWMNPAIHLILFHVKNLQELCVDENLIHDKKINYKTYLKTLSWFISESKVQPKYSLSHSIFGWSTFRELKHRIQTIHRVRPTRSQPLICFVLLSLNLIALLLIAGSTPKFQYSLREIERMYMPEYMKTEFEFLLASNNYPSFDNRHTLEFGKERGINRGIYTSDDFKKVERYRKARGSVDVLALFHINAKVIEYSDEKLTIKIDYSYPDARSALHEPYDYKNITESRVLNLSYGEVVSLENFDVKFQIFKKLSPVNEISFFPQLNDLVAARAEISDR